MRPAPLRIRVMAGFAAGALTLSAGMAAVSYQLSRGSLLAERERTAIRATYFDASLVNADLTGANPDIVEVLRSLDTGTVRRAVVYRDGTWYARTADAGVTAAVPTALQRLVAQGRPGVQRVRTAGHSALVVGVPLSPSTAFYEVHSLQELDRTLRLLALVLAVVALVTAAIGAGLGGYATRYVLRPLHRVADAAEEISAGDLTARLDPAAEPDLTRLTTSFNDMVDQLAARMERDRRFAADVSHELRSPLQTLAAAASVLSRRRDHLDERTATALTLVTDEVSRFQELVNDLLELARTDQPAVRTPVPVVELARQLCRARGLPDDIVEGQPHTEWLVDRRRFQQILENLLDNAITHAGGPVKIRLTNPPGCYRVEVDDNGPGVSPDAKTTIFHRFVRGRAASARGGGDGTGLGLALVTGHATAHGGRATVDDRPDGGARFRVDLPDAPS